MIACLSIESDEFKIRAVLQGNQRVVTADRVLAAGDDLETELLKVLGGLIEVVDDDDEVINSMNHGCKYLELRAIYLIAGTTFSRNRLSCPIWSLEVMRSVMCSMRAAQYAFNCSTHCSGV